MTCVAYTLSHLRKTLLGNEKNPIDNAPQTNQDSRPRSDPTLELHSKAASSVGITSTFQRSKHKKQFWRKADKKNMYRKSPIFSIWSTDRVLYFYMVLRVPIVSYYKYGNFCNTQTPCHESGHSIYLCQQFGK